jgi:hypothetical protein
VAVLNSTVEDATENVQVLFKSSPFGSQSHGYEAQNAFLLNLFGERIFVRSGRRDIHGSAHHQKWMWETKSVNSITVDGTGQDRHSARARGEIFEFQTSDQFDFVAGEAGPAYGGRLKTFARRILFVKPDLIVIFDTLEAPQPAAFDWWLHAAYPMRVAGQEVTVAGRRGGARLTLLVPKDLKISMTDAFDPSPRPRVKLSQWHLTATTARPERACEFVTVVEPFRNGADRLAPVVLERNDQGYCIEAKLARGHATIVLRSPTTKGRSRVEASIADASGKVEASFASREGK